MAAHNQKKVLETGTVVVDEKALTVRRTVGLSGTSEEWAVGGGTGFQQRFNEATLGVVVQDADHLNAELSQAVRPRVL